MRRLGAAPYYFFPAEHLAALHDALGERIHLVLAINDGTVLGGYVFFEYRGTIQMHLGSSSGEGMSLHVDKLLDDEMRGWAKSRGNSVYHLGGGRGGTNDALFWYKSGFSKRTHPFHTWRVIVNSGAYRELSGDGEGSNVGSYFPPYRNVGHVHGSDRV
jgi:Acetyltransferase (GNAT) domain